MTMRRMKTTSSEITVTTMMMMTRMIFLLMMMSLKQITMRRTTILQEIYQLTVLWHARGSWRLLPEFTEGRRVATVGARGWNQQQTGRETFMTLHLKLLIEKISAQHAIMSFGNDFECLCRKSFLITKFEI